MSDRPERSQQPQLPRTYSEAMAAMALGLRLIALAVVAGSGAFLLRPADSRALLAAGVLASALLGLTQSALLRRRRR